MDLNPTLGHEQRGVRPAVVASTSEVGTSQRFPMLAVVPLTRTAGQGTLYPKIGPGPTGLNQDSYALIDHLRSIDKRRVARVIGTITNDELAAIDLGLRHFLGLVQEPTGPS